MPAERLRILMAATVRPYPPDTGGLVRIFEVLRGLARHHDVTLACPGSAAQGAELEAAAEARVVVVPEPRRGPARRMAAAFSREPYHVAWYRNRALDRRVAELLAAEPFDLVYVHYLRSLQHVPEPPPVPVVLDQHNVDREMWRLRSMTDPHTIRRLMSRRIQRRTMAYEDAWAPRIAAYVSVSEADARLTREEIAGDAPCHVAPNGVDIDAVRPAGNGGGTGPGKSGRPTIGYLGSMDLPANVEAAVELREAVAPAVVERAGPVRLLIVGRRPDRRVRALASTADIDVEVTGTVPDVTEHLHRMDVFVAPLRFGGGTKLKVLHAMAAGVPVVLTPHAAQGLDLEEGREGLVAGDPAALAEGAARVLADPGLARSLAEGGRALVESAYSWRAITAELAAWLPGVVRG